MMKPNLFRILLIHAHQSLGDGTGGGSPVSNSAPVLTDESVDVSHNSLGAGAPTGAVGALVSELVDIGGTWGNVTDVDGNTPGLAILEYGVTGDVDALYYSLNNGTTWQEAIIGAVAPDEALILPPTARLYVATTETANPVSDFVIITARAWDQTGNISAGIVVEAEIKTGDNYPFSVASEAFILRPDPDVGNSSPVITDESVFISIAVDAAVPSGTVGTLVSAIVDEGGTWDNVLDTDGDTCGIAITARDNTYGTWYWSINDGTDWDTLDACDETSAMLLRPEDRVYFKPNNNVVGLVTGALTIKAWDQTDGTEGTQEDVSSSGGDTPYSFDDAPVDVNVDIVFVEHDLFAAGTATDPRTMDPGGGTLTHNDASAAVGSGNFSLSNGSSLYFNSTTTHSRAAGTVFSVDLVTLPTSANLKIGCASASGSYANVQANMQPGCLVGTNSLQYLVGASAVTISTAVTAGDRLSFIQGTNTRSHVLLGTNLVYTDRMATTSTLTTAMSSTVSGTPAIGDWALTSASTWEPVAVFAEDFSGVSDSPAVQEIQAEDFDTRHDGSTHKWWVIPTESAGVGSFTGATGASSEYMQSLSLAELDDESNDNYSMDSDFAYLEYEFTPSAAGYHQIALSQQAPDGDGDSVWVEIIDCDLVSVESGSTPVDNKCFTNGDPSGVGFVWRTVGVWNVEDTDPKTIRISMREDGAVINSIRIFGPILATTGGGESGGDGVTMIPTNPLRVSSGTLIRYHTTVSDPLDNGAGAGSLWSTLSTQGIVEVTIPTSTHFAACMLNRMDSNNYWLAYAGPTAINIFSCINDTFAARATTSVTRGTNDIMRGMRSSDTNIRGVHRRAGNTASTVVYTSSTTFSDFDGAGGWLDPVLNTALSKLAGWKRDQSAGFAGVANEIGGDTYPTAPADPTWLMRHDFTVETNTTTIPTSNGAGYAGSGGSGEAWTEQLKDWSIAGGVLNSDVSDLSDSLITMDVSNATVRMEATLNGTSPLWTGVALNVADTNNYYAAYLENSWLPGFYSLVLWSRASGVWTWTKAVPVELGTNDRVYLERISTTSIVMGHINGTTGVETKWEHAAATNANTATVHGIYQYEAFFGVRQCGCRATT